ncbi:hypothetical protein [Ancylobacter lacus]|uniref:hypothetical protein n=1 Tax=Ancylobacter lacus TaxID=2579970 RepID=UPI001BCFA493|nr:hypothetical protein [Ancylobacter lacus]MBS7537740.1 hypothetical protein [Ancylobacter lacus]
MTYQLWATEHGIHREGAPAKISRDPKTGVVVREEFYLYDNEHNEAGPSLIVRDADSGIVILEEWKQHGQFTRSGGKAALIERDPVSGVVTLEEFWLDGILLSEIPAAIPQQAPGPVDTERKGASAKPPTSRGPSWSP